MQFIGFILALLFSSLSCDSTEPPPIVPPPDLRKIILSVEDVSCTEVWLNIKADSISFPSEIILLNDTVAQTISLCCSDTSLYIDSLLPNKPYTYKAILTADTTIKSETVTAQTLDTTSHNFAWQSWEFGEHSSSVLYDVAIIDENNIWAVGEIYMNDSLGNPDPHAYNAVHWDGSEWELKRILFPTVCGSTNRTPYPAKSIFAFQDGEIWIGSSGDKIAILENGIQVSEFCLPSSLNMGINKLWGTSSNDLYVVGNGGNIAHYENGVWTKIESGTDLNINDIWGDYNDKTGEWEILAVAANIYESLDRDIRRIKNDETELLDEIDITKTISSIWFKTGRKYILGTGSGLYRKTDLTENVWADWFPGFTQYYILKLRGNDLNDITGAGGVGELIHFNGITMKSYFNETKLLSGNYYSISVRENNIVAVGEDNARAVLTLGKR